MLKYIVDCEILNSSISLLRIFIYNWSIQKIYLLSGFSFDYFKATLDFSRVSKYSVSKTKIYNQW